MDNQTTLNQIFVKKSSLALLFIQIFATLSFAVLYLTLIFYLTKSLKIDDNIATSITAEFVALSFLLHLLGGIIGGRFFSFRALFIISMSLQLAGLLLLSIANIKLMYWALAIYLTGNGFNMTCINCMLSQLFVPEDKRREKAFLWNYSAMNTGYFIGFTMGGYFLLKNNYHLLFILSAAANVIALSATLIGWKYLKDNTTPRNTKTTYITLALLLALLTIALTWLLQNYQFTNAVIITIVTATLLLIIYFAYKEKQKDISNKIWVYLILFVAAFCFYTISLLAPTGLNLFINRNVDLNIVGITVAPQWVQNLNPIVAIIFGPILAKGYAKLRTRGYKITIPSQFVLSLMIMGTSIVILPVGIYFSNSTGLSNISWPMISVILQGLAEVSFTPIGFAMVGQLTPLNFRGFFMGYWLTCIGMGAIFAGYFSKFALGNMHTTNPLITNLSFSHSFNLLGWSTIGIGFCLLFFTPLLKRWTD